MRRILLALSPLLCLGCGKPPLKITFECDGITLTVEDDGWKVSDESTRCGCLKLLDGKGKTLATEMIKDGTGGGPVPPGTEDAELYLVSCEGFEGCDQEAPGPAPPAAGARPRKPFRSIGAGWSGARLGLHDLTLAAASTAEAETMTEQLLTDLDAVDLAPGAAIDSLSIYDPLLADDGSVLGFRGLILDDEPIEALAVSVDGVVVFATADAPYRGHGFWGVEHVIGAEHLDLLSGGERDEIVTRTSTPGAALIESRLLLELQGH